MKTLWLSFAILALGATAYAQIDLGTTDTSDGSVNQYAYQFRMDLAPTGVWNQPAPIPGRGVYDPNLWAVVYKFDSFNSGDVGITPHPSGCPIVILANNFNSYNTFNIPLQAGGFMGGLPSQLGRGSAGLGLGGAQSGDGSVGGGPASHGTAGVPYNALSQPAGDIYGNPAIIPLVGGSGGGSFFGQGGGYGGGAILIAVRNTFSSSAHINVQANGQYTANGGTGSGGAIRIIANTVTGGGLLNAGPRGTSDRNAGGAGRVRIEANTFGTWGSAQPAASLATVGPVAKLWPANTDPSVKIATVNAINAPSDPGPAFQSPDVNLGNAGTYTVVIEARNVPTNGTWTVSLRGVPAQGDAVVYPCTFTSGNQAVSFWSANVPFTNGMQVLQARAKKN